MADRDNQSATQSAATHRVLLGVVALCLVAGFAGSRSDTHAGWPAIAMLLACQTPIVLGAWCAAGRLLNRRRDRSWSAASLVLTAQVYFVCFGAIGLLLGGLRLFTPPFAMIAPGLVGLLLVYWGRRHTAFAMPRLSRRPLVALVQIATALLVALVAFKCLLAPDYDYDVLTYHLMFPARWVQDAAIFIVPTWFGDPAPAYAPCVTEVYYAWLMLPLQGDMLARCGQLPFYLLLLAASGGVALELRLPRVVCVWIPLAVGLVPSILFQAATAMVDVAFAAHLVCVVYFALRCRVSDRSGDIVGLILSLGLLLGTKFLALPYCVALAPLVLWALRRWFKSRSAMQGERLPIVVASVLALCVGGFWYARNWALTSNPLCPLETRIGDTIVFDGAYGRPQMENWVFNAHRGASEYAFGEALWGMLHLPSSEPEPDGRGSPVALKEWYKGAAGAILLAYCAGIVGVFRMRRRRLRGVLFYLNGVLLFIVFWYVLPFQQPRFALGIVALTVVGAAGAVRVHRRARWVLPVLVAAVWTSTFSKEWQQWFSPVFSTEQRSHDPRLAAMQAPRWEPLSDAWRRMDRQLHGATIAYAGNNVPYFLCGRSLENRVVYVPARKPMSGAFHDFAMLPECRALGRPNTSEPACDRYVMLPGEWLDNLKALDVDYVFVSEVFPNLLPNYRHDMQGFPIEREWLDQLCSMQAGGRSFAERHVFEGGAAMLFKLNRDVWPPHIDGLREVVQKETDALSLLGGDAAALDDLNRFYPHAKGFIEWAGLKPLR